MKLIFPAGIGKHHNINGVGHYPDANGMLDIGNDDPTHYLRAGFTLLPDTFGTTAQRPTTNVAAGSMYLDSTLGKPIWRNAANTGWIDATGASV